MIKRDGGFGKVILLGEHFVVYNLPALIATLDLQTIATVSWYGDGKFAVIDERFKVPSFKATKKELYDQMIRSIFNFMGTQAEGWRVTLLGTLPVTDGGIGASAAAAVAVARAINQTLDLKWEDDRICQAALCGEQVIHGNPSGIDNTAATLGGVFVYQRGLGDTAYYRQEFLLTKPLYLVIADSGRMTNIRQVLAAVAAMKVQKQEVVDRIFQKYSALFSRGIDAFERGDMGTLGLTMTENHHLLKEMGLSSPELNFLVAKACTAGALGAKVTGTGCGGIMVALADGVAQQDFLVSVFEQHGFFALATVIDRKIERKRVNGFLA